MKELDGLREALASGTPGPWKEMWQGIGGEVICADFMERISDRDRRAIVLSVNLAPALLRVAEAASIVSGLTHLPGPEGDDLRAALDALRAGAKGGL